MEVEEDSAQARLRHEIRAWLNANASLRSSDGVDWIRAPEDLATAKAWQNRKFVAGWAGLTWPVSYGGQGRPAIDQIIWDQEAESFEVPEETFIGSTMLVGPTIVDVGSAEQKSMHLDAILRGDEIWCQLFSEPGAGSDLAGVSTRAVLDVDGSWVITGQKVWSSGAHYSDWGILLARTDTAAEKHAGLSMFLLDMRCPGVTVRPIKQITGAQHFNEVFLDEVRVPATELLGAPGEGWKVARITLMHERLGLISRRRVEVGDLLALVRGASFDGQRMIVRDDVRQEMAEIWMRALALRSLGQKTLASIADGEIPGPEGSIGKLAGAQLLNQMGRFATNLLGPGALLDGPDSPDGGRWQYAFLDATARRIAGGSDEIQRNIIAERVLGMPRDR